MNTIIITPACLTDAISNFPIAIVRRMCECQREQNKNVNFSVFAINPCATAYEGGFDWDETVEGFSFWCDVINNKNFNKFFELYPNKSVCDTEYDDEFINDVRDCLNTLYENYDDVPREQWEYAFKMCLDAIF